jgi:hypothetical protein
LDTKFVKVEPVIVGAEELEHRFFDGGEGKGGFELDSEFGGTIGVGVVDHFEE